uniref:Uncharacterized protein TCIL3000_1_1640 n=1 Tax=Trypanosoma congolense (strain IL3000) TaxID=1068625 RepID=G0UJ46_TRYCI|nr:unnamed protein product [Trypanosoma congolense IL3000]
MHFTVCFFTPRHWRRLRAMGCLLRPGCWRNGRSKWCRQNYRGTGGCAAIVMSNRNDTTGMGILLVNWYFYFSSQGCYLICFSVPIFLRFWPPTHHGGRSCLKFIFFFLITGLLICTQPLHHMTRLPLATSAFRTPPRPHMYEVLTPLLITDLYHYLWHIMHYHMQAGRFCVYAFNTVWFLCALLSVFFPHYSVPSYYFLFFSACHTIHVFFIKFAFCIIPIRKGVCCAER